MQRLEASGAVRPL